VTDLLGHDAWRSGYVRNDDPPEDRAVPKANETEHERCFVEPEPEPVSVCPTCGHKVIDEVPAKARRPYWGGRR